MRVVSADLVVTCEAYSTKLRLPDQGCPRSPVPGCLAPHFSLLCTQSGVGSAPAKLRASLGAQTTMPQIQEESGRE